MLLGINIEMNKLFVLTVYRFAGSERNPSLSVPKEKRQFRLKRKKGRNYYGIYPQHTHF